MNKQSFPRWKYSSYIPVDQNTFFLFQSIVLHLDITSPPQRPYKSMSQKGQTVKRTNSHRKWIDNSIEHQLDCWEWDVEAVKEAAAGYVCAPRPPLVAVCSHLVNTRLCAEMTQLPLYPGLPFSVCVCHFFCVYTSVCRCQGEKLVVICGNCR